MSDTNISSYIIYKDRYILVCYKPNGLPVQDDKTGDASLLKLLEIYTKQKLFLIQRLDRPVSGILVFAKTKEAAADLQQQMQQNKFSKTYLAIVPLKEINASGEIVNWLSKSTKNNKTFISNENDKAAKKSTLQYEIIEKLDNYMCLKISNTGGRFHQIRAQLAAYGLPIKGDVKYGARRSNKDRSILLHASSISFLHPKTQEVLQYSVPTPSIDIWPAFQTTK